MGDGVLGKSLPRFGWGDLMDTIIRRCRELLTCARNAAVVEQLRLWLEELEQQTATLASQAEDAGQRLTSRPAR